MKRSLRSSVMLVLVTINLVVFGAAGGWLTQTLAQQSQSELNLILRGLEQRMQQSIVGSGELRAAGILSWEGWRVFRDALVVRLPPSEQRSYEPRGVMLNPLGAAGRGVDFDFDSILEDIEFAVDSNQILRTERGVSMPLFDPQGDIWGGCWLYSESTWSLTRLLRILLPWFGVSTLLLVAGSYFALDRLVVRPVRKLAEGTNRLAEGDLSARLLESGGQDELSHLVREFNGMALQIQGFGRRLEDEVESATEKARRAEAVAMNQRRLAATGELAAGIAHEINNPLGGLLNAVEALGRPDLPPDRRAEYLELVRGALERIRHTVGGVLRLAPRRSVTSAVDLAGPIGDALELIRHRASVEGVGIWLARGRSEPVLAVDHESIQPLLGARPVEAEVGEIGQAVLNLIVNALDALRDESSRERTEPKRILVRLDDRGDDVELSIEDNGPGMPPDLVDRACDPFFSTKDPGQGTGLGLAIVGGMVNGIGGRLEIDNRPGQGFRVTLCLPPAERDAAP